MGVNPMLFTESLKKNHQFRFVYNRGRSIANRYLVMYVVKNSLDINRIGYSVSKKVGNSVVRSRVTRLLRESYRLNEHMLESGFDIVVVARAAMKDASYADAEHSLKHLLKKHRLLKEQKDVYA